MSRKVRAEFDNPFANILVKEVEDRLDDTIAYYEECIASLQKKLDLSNRALEKMKAEKKKR